MSLYEPRLIADTKCTVGEGPLWHAARQRLFWFAIGESKMLSADADGQNLTEHHFEEEFSAAGIVDDNTLLLASETGFWHFDIRDNGMAQIEELEADKTITRSNDGRADRHGGFWIGTMGKNAEEKAGAIYRFYKGSVRKLVGDVSISNSICFSPDGSDAYFVDTVVNIMMKWALDENGWPVGEAEPFIDNAGAPFGMDGSVVDSKGYIWNAQWGASRVVRYAPEDGHLDMVVELPTSNITCPCFGGPDLKTMFVTSATDDLSEAQLAEFTGSGGVFAFEIEVAGLPDGIVQIEH